MPNFKSVALTKFLNQFRTKTLLLYLLIAFIGTTIDVEAYPIFPTQTEVIREQCTTSKDTGYCIVRLVIPDYWFNSSYTNALITFKQNGNEQSYSIDINYPFVPALQPLSESSVFLVAPSTTYYSGQIFYVNGYVFVTGFLLLSLWKLLYTLILTSDRRKIGLFLQFGQSFLVSLFLTFDANICCFGGFFGFFLYSCLLFLLFCFHE